MALVDRVKNILFTPKTEWPVIAGETATVQSLYTGYIMILAAIGPLVTALMYGVGVAVLSYLIGLAMVYVLALIADALAPRFGGEKNFIRALQLVAYGFTAAWVGVILQVVPFLGALLGLAAVAYSVYIFYLGAPVLRKCAPDKAVGYTVVVILCGIGLSIVVSFVLFGLVGGGMMMR
jgi:hypothetical protein